MLCRLFLGHAEQDSAPFSAPVLAWAVELHLIERHGLAAQPVQQPAPEQRTGGPQQHRPGPARTALQSPRPPGNVGAQPFTAHRAGRQQDAGIMRQSPRLSAVDGGPK